MAETVHENGGKAIAVVGMACRLPGAADPAAFWRLLCDGVDALSAPPPGRRPAGAAPRAGYLPGVDRFDAPLFGMSPRTAAATDPQQRLALELGWEAFEDAGITPGAVAGHRVGVWFGAMADGYAALLARDGAAPDRDTVPGLSRTMIAGRLSHALGLRGPSMVVDTGQSSSLTAVHAACAALRAGEARLALAGGVHLNLDPAGDDATSAFGALSPRGRCATLDADADGYARGEGGGAVLLRPLDDARAAGDRVYCVVTAGAVNNDGGGPAPTVPTADGQREVLRAAHRRAGGDPHRVQYVELHGTGTAVGDPVEATAVAAELAAGRPADAPLAVGSVKTNIGHLEGAAGIAGLLKLALAVHHRTLPASLHHRTPHPVLRGSGLRVVTEPAGWPRPGERLRGAVTSVGMGGSNCHLVVDEAPAPPDAAGAGPAVAGPHLVTLSGATDAGLRAQADRLAAHVDGGTDGLADLARSAATTRTALRHRAAVVAEDRAELLAGLRALAAGEPAEHVATGRAADGATAFVFSGQGAQRAGMGTALAAADPIFARHLDTVCSALDEHLPGALRTVLATGGDGALDRTGWTQPALFAHGLALARTLLDRGVAVDHLLGHSVGEIAAAQLAGVLSLRDACVLVTARGRVMDELPPGGAMLAVAAPEAELADRVAGRPDLAVAAVNGPASCVVSGAADAVGEIARWAAETGLRHRRLPVSHAFHSPLMDPALDRFAGVVAGLDLQPPQRGLVSAVTGAPVGAEITDPAYWVRHARDAVRFADAVTAAEAAGVTRWCEVGPRAGLTAAVRDCLTGDHPAVVVAAQRHDRPEPPTLLAAVGALHAHGADLDPVALLDGRGGRRVPLPGYAFQRSRYWLPAPFGTAPAGVAPPAPAAGADVAVDGTGPDAPAVTPAAARLRAATGAPRRSRIALELVRGAAAAVLGHPGPSDVDPDLTFGELGVDSLGAVELRDRLGAALGTTLPASLLFDHPRPTALAGHLAERHGGAGDGPALGTAAPDHPAGPRGPSDDPVVVVGMGCRFPGGVTDPQQLWDVVAGGRDVTGDFPTDRGWDLGALLDGDPDTPGTSWTRRGGFLTGVARFDAAFFGISAREARAMDPQQRLVLETTWEALERAGIPPRSRHGERVGVYLGATAGEYGPRLDAGDDRAGGYVLTGTTPSVVSGRVAYSLGLRGPALTVDTACSSSLVAIDLAARAVRSGEVTAAVAGGVTVLSGPGMFVEMSRQRGLSRDGRCRAFSADADGTGWAEGAGVVVLERLSTARACGHPVLAVLRGSAVNSDGASNGLTAPSGVAQQAVLRDALAAAGITADGVDVVEAHGTGTRLGDPIEAQALREVYGTGRTGPPLALGSVKSNIGHTQAAAGVAGLIKMVLALQHRVLPATLHAERPSELVEWDGVQVLTAAREWTDPGRPRRAGVSSFGISGTNAHVVVEEAPAADPVAAPAPPGPPAWRLSARDPQALAESARRLVAAVEADPDGLGVGVVAAALARGRTWFPHRAVVLGADRDALLAGLRGLADGRPDPAAVVQGTGPADGRVVFVFPGQGAQWAPMGRALYRECPVFAAELDRCAAALAPHLDEDVVEVVTGDDDGWLDRVETVQPALFAVMVALAATWRAWGVEPAAVVGHSQGEIAAACVAGALSLPDAARVVALRARAIRRIAGGGAMLSVGLGRDEVADWLATEPGLALAAHNGARSVVVSGAADAVARLQAALEAHEVRVRRIPVDYASHSAHVESIAAEILDDLAPISPRPPAVPMYSTVHAAPVDAGTPLDAAYWVANLRGTVELHATVETVLADGHDVLVEVGPHPVLLPVVAETVDAGETAAATLPTLHRDAGDLAALTRAWARAQVAGAPLAPAAGHPGVPPAPHPPALPTYPFRGEEHWIVPPASAAARPAGPALHRLDWVPGPDPRPLTGRWARAAAAGGAVATGGGVAALPEHDPADPPDLLVLAIPPAGDPPVPEAVRSATGTTLHVLQQLLADPGAAATRLLVLTRGAVAATDGEAPDPAGAAVWGLLRSAASEHPGRILLVDTDPADHPRPPDRLPAGEPQVAVRGHRMLVPRLAAVAPAAVTPPDLTGGTVLVTGATGTLGGLVAEHLVTRHGVRDLLLLGRRGPSAAGAAELVARLERAGARVTLLACDVADRAALTAALGTVPADRPLTGVVHTAGVLDDGVVTALSEPRLDAALRPKLDAAVLLDELAGDVAAFVLFSSMVGTLGNPGQAAYAAANAALDALAARRRAAGRPATALGWGFWDERTGMSGHLADRDLTRMARDGLVPLPTGAALDLFDAALGGDRPNVLPLHLDPAAVRRPAAELPPPLRGPGRPAGADHGPDGPPPTAGWADLASDDRAAHALDLVRGLAAEVLGLAAADLEPGRAFRDAGFDSLTAVELRNRLAAATGHRLATTAVFDHPSPRALAAELCRVLPGATAAAEVPAGPAGAAVAGPPASGVAPDDDPVVVVATACRLPGGVRSPEDLWEMLLAGRDGVVDLPADRGWPADLYAPDGDRAGTSYVARGGFLTDAADFDAEFFGIAPREALAMDPQQRILLETVWEALERAGIAPGSVRGERYGVYVGANGEDYTAGRDGAAELEGYLLTGTAASVASGRIAYVLGTEGPAVTVDTACSSSLVALHLAAQALRAGECTVALAGGVTVMSSPRLLVEFSRQRGLAPDGLVKPFSADADGTAWGEGAAVLVLERLSRARAHGHRVLGVVRGSAVNSDGASNGITAPSGPSQQRVVTDALARAGVSAAAVDVLEAHGTGTRLGDPIEAGAVLATYGRDRDPRHPLRMGSVKANTGHTQAAAGATGVIKLLLAMRHGHLPATPRTGEPTGHVDWSGGAVELVPTGVDWPERDGTRLGAVSAFGIGGTNAHVVLEQAPPAPEGPPAPPAPAPPVPAWPVSGRSPEDVREQAARLAGHPAVGGPDPADPARLAHALRTTRTHGAHRAVVVGGTREELLAGLGGLARDGAAGAVVTGTAGDGRTAFLFTGQGAQRAGMGDALAAACPEFAEAHREVRAALDAHLPRPLAEVVTDGTDLHRTRWTQPALFALEVALFRVLEAWGVRPDRVAGHSIGEIAAAHCAGALTLDDAAVLITERGRLMDGLPGGGAMLSVRADEDTTRGLLAGLTGVLDVAAVNGPDATVVAGDRAACDALRAVCADAGIRTRDLRVSHAFHSRLMDPVLDAFAGVAAAITPRPLRIGLVSTRTGTRLDTAALADPAHWVAHARHTVRFRDAVAALEADGVTRFVEIGPDAVLTAATGDCLTGPAALRVPTLRRGRDEARTVSSAVAALWAHGHEPAGDAARPAGVVDLPTTGFRPRRYWHEPAPVAAATARAGVDGAGPADDTRFWELVDGGDPQRLADLTGLDAGRPLAALLPDLARWRDRRTRRAAAGRRTHRLDWPVARPTDASAPDGLWVVLGPSADTATGLGVQQALAAAGTRFVTCDERPDPDDAPARVADAVAAAAGGAPVAGVLCLLGLDETPDPARPGLTRGLAGAVLTARALAGTDSGPAAGARLWIVTRGGAAVAGGVVRPHQAALWGLARTLSLEIPARWGGVVDLPVDEPAAPAPAGLVPVLADRAAGGAEDQVALRGNTVHVPRLVPAPPAGDGPGWVPRGTVLVTGGTGALGGHVARWAAGAGASHVVLAGRRGPAAPGAPELTADIERAGARATVVACDTGDAAALTALVERLDGDGDRLTAVVHAAGTGGFDELAATDADALARLFAGKVGGALALDAACAGRDLDAFVLFSSVAATWGSGGQAGYAAANAALDGLAADRHARGEVATSVAWGPWADTGMITGAGVAEHLGRRGLRPMDLAGALDALAAVVGGPDPTPVVADVDWARFVVGYTAAGHRPLLDALPGVAGRTSQDPPVPAAAAAAEPVLARRLATLPAAEQRMLVLDLVRAEAASVLGHACAADVDPDRGFADLGFDSLMAVELRDRIAAVTGVALGAAAVFDHPAPALLTAALLGELVGDPAGGPALPVFAELDRVEAALPELVADTGLAAALADRMRQLAAALSAPRPGADGHHHGAPVGADTGSRLSSASADELFQMIDEWGSA
ncbi:type I polyketide synthase [Pseudonocardia alni]|uniref:type I polyketide synthase n=1 Tax=Pseudonocardia alni TaxID=33907 RepID=UPI0033C69AAE